MLSNNIFRDRKDAGGKLASLLFKYKEGSPIILALPRGGVIVAKEVKEELNAPLGVIVIKKIGHPFSPEYAIGAISENGSLAVNKDEVREIDYSWFKDMVEKLKQEARKKHDLYLGGKSPISIKNKTVIIVDDGLATGLTMLAAIQEVKNQGAGKIVVAVPVAPSDTALKIKEEVDDFVACLTPEDFMGAVGAYYQNFEPVLDEEVINTLKNV